MAVPPRYAASLLAVAICTATSMLRAQVPQLSPLSSVTTLRYQWNAAMIRRDTARLGSLMRDDAVFLSADVRLDGRDQVIALFGRLFTSRPDIRLVFTIDTLVPAQPVVTDSIVSEYGTWQETFIDPGGTVIQRGTYYDIWRRGPDGWRIAVHGFARTSCMGNPTYCRGGGGGR